MFILTQSGFRVSGSAASEGGEEHLNINMNL